MQLNVLSHTSKDLKGKKVSSFTNLFQNPVLPLGLHTSLKCFVYNLCFARVNMKTSIVRIRTTMIK